MPTNQNTYNTRVTDESLEKRFRDTFRSQGGAELVDDLYASGVIIPVVDFTAAAEGTNLPSELQQAWDFATGSGAAAGSTTATVINTTGFWKLLFTYQSETAGTNGDVTYRINDGLGTKIIWNFDARGAGTNFFANGEQELIVFLRSGDTLECVTDNGARTQWAYRQIADVNGNPTNPLGFTSS